MTVTVWAWFQFVPSNTRAVVEPGTSIPTDTSPSLASPVEIPTVTAGGVTPVLTDDPLAVPASVSLPEIPAVGRPVQIELGALRQYFEARGAVIVDAREAWEFEEGHIPGALSLPYDEAATDPARLESLDTAGRPIITYCGGGSCELSLNLADELIYAGHPQVAVFMGGFPEWIADGLPVEAGP